MVFSKKIVLVVIVIAISSGLVYFVSFSDIFDDTLNLKNSKYNMSMGFLKKQMHNHKTIYQKLVNGKGNFVEFSPYSYKDLYQAKNKLDSFKKVYTLVQIEEEDTRKISEEFLGSHVSLSIKTWKNSKFSNHVNFDDFSNYMLPYRAGQETLSDYRENILKSFSTVFDSIQHLKTPKQAVEAINTVLKENIEFDLRSHSDLNSPGIIDVLEQKKGSCKDITQFTALVMRTQGLAVAIDECPVWAHRNSGHQWNTFLNSDSKWTPFGGAETNPDEFISINDSVKAPKVFRHTYSFQDNFGPPIENLADVPNVFHQKNRIDVTKEYVSTSNVTVNLEDNVIKNNGILYLAVFNAEQWKIVSWAKIENGRAVFNEMGNNNIIYLPVFYEKGVIVPSCEPFLLTPNSKIIINPDLNSKDLITLKNYNKFYDIQWNVGIPKTDWRMELLYWNNEWVSCGINTVKKDNQLHFKIPKDGLYLIKSHDWENTWQRIFTIKDNEQIWY